MPIRKTPRVVTISVCALTFVFLFQAIASMWNDAPTFDEMVSPAAGYAEIFTGDLRLIDDHPPLARTLMALPLLIFQPELPLDHLSWREKEKQKKYRYDFAGQFFYVANHAPERMLFWSRLPIVGLSLLLGFLVFHWATELYGTHAGLLALFLYVLEPNVMAHSRLATNDVPLTLLIFCTVLQFWHYRRGPSLKAFVLTGTLLGLALLTKFSALLLLPMIFLLGFFVPPIVIPKAWAQTSNVRTLGRKAGEAALTVFGTFAIACMVILSFYHIRVWLFIQSLANAVIHYGAGHLALRGHPAFLLGELSLTGWWYYFPVAFAVKTPIPLLIFILIALLSRSFRKDQAGFFLLIPAGIILLAALTSDLNIGLRHILPAYPFLIVLASSVPIIRFSRPGFFAGIFATLGVWYLTSAVRIFPSYLAYFNEFVGPENGYKVLVDSNLDWGQDLKRLKRFMNEKGIQEVYLSYFGTANPCHYGIIFLSLPDFSSDCQQKPEPRSADYIAISATNLQSVYLPLQSYEWLKERRPTAQIGYSIFVYDIRRNAAAHNELGILFLQYKKFQEAIAEFKSVTALEPRTSTAYVNLGVAYSYLADFRLAEKAFRRALELDPDNETAKKGLAVIAAAT